MLDGQGILAPLDETLKASRMEPRRARGVLEHKWKGARVVSQETFSSHTPLRILHTGRLVPPSGPRQPQMAGALWGVWGALY